MATYEYTCPDHGLTEVSLPMGSAPVSLDCPECGAPARRVYSSPRVSSVDATRMGLIDATKATAEQPAVVTSIPGQRSGPPQRMAPPDPRLKKLPRP